MIEKQFADFADNYASLGSSGEICSYDGGDALWSLGEQLDKIGEDWLVTEFYFENNWPSWERHPNADEVVYLLSGSADMLLEKDDVRRKVELRGKGLVIVPRGTWHTAKILEPSNMLVITLGKGTEHRPVG